MKSTFLSILLSTLFLQVSAQPLSGTYTIGATGNFTSLSDAFENAMTEGISDPVTFSVLSGIYNEQISVGEIPGASASNRLIVESQSGNADDVVIWYEPTINDNYVLQLNGTDFLDVRNLTLQATGSTAGHVLDFFNTCTYLNFSGVKFYGLPVTSESSTHAVIYSNQIAIGTTDNPQYNIFNNCEINHGSYGMYWSAQGTSGVRADSNIVSNLTLNNQYYVGLWLVNQQNTLVTGNKITAPVSAASSWTGIRNSSAKNAFTIQANQITASVTSSTNLYGMVLDNQSSIVTSGYSCFNNMISLSSSGTVYGIEAYNTRSLTIIYNSILIHQSAGSPVTGSAGLYLRSTVTGLTISNNLIANRALTPAIRYNSTTALPTGIVASDYNGLYSTGTTIIELTQTAEFFADIATWQSTHGYDVHSVVLNPSWISDSDLHLTGSAMANEQYTGNPGVTSVDIDGENRSSVSPYKGADETGVPITGEFSGTIPVGTGGYSTLTEALNAISARGFSGAITISLSPGTYNEQILISESLGSGENQSVTITSSTGQADDVILSFDPTSENNYIVKFDGADYIQLNKITIEATGSDAGILIDLVNAADHLTFDNVVFNGIETTETSSEFALIHSNQNIIGTTQNTQFLTVENCSFNDGSTGVYFFANGTGGVRADAIRLLSNSFNEQSNGGIYLRAVKNAEVNGNRISREPGESVSWTGIQVSSAQVSFTVSANSVVTSGNTSASLRGIILDNQSSTGSVSYWCMNNMITLSSSGDVFGMEIYNTYDLAVIHNSILLHDAAGSSSVSSSGIYFRSNIQSQTILNNIVINRSGTKALRFNSTLSTPESALVQCDYNNWFSNGSVVISIPQESADYGGVSQWTTDRGFDLHSVSTDLSFISDSDLHLSEGSIGNSLLTGTATTVDTDFDGENRDMVWPYMGADENLSFSLPVELSAFTGSISGSAIQLIWITLSEQNNAGFFIDHLKSDNQLPTGGYQWVEMEFIPGFGTTNEPKTYTWHYSIQNLNGREQSFRLRQVDTDGKQTISQVLTIRPEYSSFQLVGNFPNPFNPATHIYFTLPYQSDVTITIYDVTGRIVSKTVGLYPPGTSGIQVDASHWASGVYLYSLQWNNLTKHGKMILTK